MKTPTIRLALISACLIAGCGAFPTNGPAPGTAEVSMAPTDPEVLANLSGMRGSGYGYYSPTPGYSATPSYPPTPSYAPSYEPSHAPTPSYAPSYAPTPSYAPSYEPSPSHAPSYAPSYAPTPSHAPTYYPTPTPTPKHQDCCKVTGGGFILEKAYGDGKGKKGDLRINYGFNAQFGPDGMPKGNVNVVVHVDGPGNLQFKSDTVDSIVCKLDDGSQHPRLTGTVTVTGDLKGTGTYVLKVVDNGEPGVNDAFTFTTSTGFSFSGTVDGGNIQIHRDKCD